MENVVLYYFPIKGLGEGLRMLLTYGGQKFEDHRVPKDQWPEFKPKTPFGQMPVLEINGKKISQTLAIARYLGRKYGIAGDNLEESFEIDQNMDFFTDIRLKASTVMLEQDPAIKEKIKADLEKNYYPEALKKLNELIGKNNGHIANGKLSWGDFVIAGVYDAMKNMLLQMPDLDEKYPNLSKLRDNVISLPKVKEYVASAPKTDI
ncbi:glutathione S-transferase 2 [Pieris rapae]|uniref:glutathione transferase n=1 Tax=Pieris rapae TaxID=64459 RepID=A0A1P8L0T6_PIERA|nr:glutathione S-transferase 2 [Pieris rapae]APW77578.1 glutathione S-transferase sigma 2 [Pieris rapae]